MEKEIIKRGARQNYVLYEEAEPLFPPSWRNERYKRVKMMICAAVAVVTVAVGIFWGISLLGGTGGGGGSPSGALTDTDGAGGQLPAQSTEAEQPTESELPSESQPPTESEDAPTRDTESTLVPDVPEEQTFAETDVSELDKGEDHVINYTSKKLDVKGLLHRGFVYSESRGSQAPVVMVIHTHTSEKYLGEGDSDALGLGSVVSVGDEIVASLNSLGLTAIHCTVIHDGGEGNAYIAARETVKTMLKIYPSIKYVIDVHRMSLEEEDGTPLSTALTDSGEAQMRISVSTDVKREGDWQDDLCLALALRGELNADEKRACAPVTVQGGGYNGDLSRFYLTLDVGAEGNNVVQAIKAGKSFAKALATVVLEP